MLMIIYHNNTRNENMPTRGEVDEYDEEGADQYDDQIAAYPLEVTVTIAQDLKEKVHSIYKTIRSEHGQENEVLCQTGIPVIMSRETQNPMHVRSNMFLCFFFVSFDLCSFVCSCTYDKIKSITSGSEDSDFRLPFGT